MAAEGATTKDDEPYAANRGGRESADAAAALVAALGTPGAKQKDAEQILRPDGHLAVGPAARRRGGAGRPLRGAGRGRGARAGGPARRRRRSGGGCFSARPRPRREVDLAGGPGAVKKRALEEYDRAEAKQGRGPAPAAERASIEAFLDFFAPALADTTAAELGVALGADKGVRLVLRARPAPGSAFAKRLAARAPYEVDPRLLAGEAPVSLGAVGASPLLLQLYQGILDAQARAGVKGAAELAGKLRPVLGQLTGAMGVSFRPVKGAFAYDVVMPLKAGVTAGGGAGLAGRPGGQPCAARGPSRGLRPGSAHDQGGAAGRAAAHRAGVLRRRSCGDARGRGACPLRFEPRWCCWPRRRADGCSSPASPGAGARLEALAGPAPTPRPAPAVQATLDETRGFDGFGYADLWGCSAGAGRCALGTGGADGERPLAMPGLSRLSLPISVSFAGGDSSPPTCASRCRP
jgi:hypothetical protein